MLLLLANFFFIIIIKPRELRQNKMRRRFGKLTGLVLAAKYNGRVIQNYLIIYVSQFTFG